MLEFFWVGSTVFIPSVFLQVQKRGNWSESRRGKPRPSSKYGIISEPRFKGVIPYSEEKIRGIWATKKPCIIGKRLGNRWTKLFPSNSGTPKSKGPQLQPRPGAGWVPGRQGKVRVGATTEGAEAQSEVILQNELRIILNLLDAGYTAYFRKYECTLYTIYRIYIHISENGGYSQPQEILLLRSPC